MNNWNSYYVSNDQVLALFKTLEETPKRKDEIVSHLLKSLNYLIYTKIKKYKNKIFYFDLLQEGKLGLLTAIRDFDRTRGINFFKFACWHIQHKIKLYLKWHRKSNRITRETKDEDIYFACDNIEQNETQLIIMQALNKLPDIDKNVLIMRFGINSEFFTFEQIGNKLSLSKQRIEQIQKRALLKLKNNKEIRLLAE